MADPEGAADLSIVETPSYALAVVLLFFLTITFVADFALKGTRGFLERRSKKGLLVSLLWLQHVSSDGCGSIRDISRLKQAACALSMECEFGARHWRP